MTEETIAILLGWVKAGAMVGVTWLMWSLRGIFKAGWEVRRFVDQFEVYKKDQVRECADLRKDIDEQRRRMDRAGVQMSDLASDVQGLPERLRGEFLLRREADLLTSESRMDRERLRGDIANIWKVVNRREDERHHK